MRTSSNILLPVTGSGSALLIKYDDLKILELPPEPDGGLLGLLVPRHDLSHFPPLPVAPALVLE